MTILRTCTVCARIVHDPPGGNRCPQHPKPPKRGRGYFNNARHVRATATVCHLCGKPFTDPNDPPVADHVIPRARGGSDEVDNLRAAHKSCNGRRGATITSWSH